MADRRPDNGDSKRVKRQKTEDMDKSNIYLKGMSDADGGVSLNQGSNKQIKAEDGGHGNKQTHLKHETQHDSQCAVLTP